MPTYEYQCTACGHSFEKFQSIKASRLRKCPKCGKFKLRRLIGSGGAVLFKGSGFYETDYKRPAPSTPCDKCDSKSECPAAKPDSSSSSTDSADT